jgi:hypothetical protein
MLLVAGLGVATLVTQRRMLAERALVRWLAARGVTAFPRVSWFGIGGLELRDLSLGAADLPDLDIDRIAVRWSAASLIGRRATSVEVLGTRLRVRWEQGRPSVGVLDAMLRPTGDSASGAPRLPIDSVEFHDVRIDLDMPAGLVTARGNVDVTDEPGGTRARGDLHAETPWGAVRLVGEAHLASSAERRTRWKAALSAATLEVPGVVHVTGFAARGRGAGEAIRANFAAERATPVGVSGPIEPVHLTGTLGGSLERLVVEATAATVQDGLLLSISGEVWPLATRADLDLRLADTPLDGVKPGRLLPALAGNVTQLRGTVAAEGHARWRDGTLGAELTVAFRDVDVVTSMATVRQLNGVVTVVGPPGVATPASQTIAMAGIEGALPLQDGVVVFELEPGAMLRLERAEWRLAEGWLRASGRVPLGADERTLTLVADSLDVAALLASLAFEGLSGTGTLSGTIPLRQRGDVLVVEGGHLEATTPGTLRYQRPAGTDTTGTGHEQLDVLLAVLTDFHYDELALTLSGDTAKPMDMTLHIRGRNPGYQSGRPVVFNVAIEAPLTGLVRAGRSTYRVPAAIEKRLESMGIKGTR